MTSFQHDTVIGIFLLLLGLLIFRYRLPLKRWWLRSEDPRPLALFRIVWGMATIVNFDHLWPLFRFLFTNEGLFDTGQAAIFYARQRLNPDTLTALRGNPETLGPQYWADVLFGSQTSLLYVWDSPTTFWIHWSALHLAALAFIVGVRTRMSGWCFWALLVTSYSRNLVTFGGDKVFIIFLFYLALSRCGEAFSVDAWIASKKIMRKMNQSDKAQFMGRLRPAPSSRPHHHSLRPIPAWPINLMIIQVVVMYFVNGLHKQGTMWISGDSFYYLINNDAFYRWPWHRVSTLFHDNLFRVMTWVTITWELSFPLVMVGVFRRFFHNECSSQFAGHKTGPWNTLRPLGKIDLGLCFGLAAIVWQLCLDHHRWAKQWSIDFSLFYWGVVIFLLASWTFNTRPIPHHRFLAMISNGIRKLDPLWAGMGSRKLWLSLGAAFHLSLGIFVSLGLFSILSPLIYLVFFSWTEIHTALVKAKRFRLSKLASYDSKKQDQAGPKTPPFTPLPTLFQADHALTTPLRQRLMFGFVSLHLIAMLLLMLPKSNPPEGWHHTSAQWSRSWMAFLKMAQSWTMFVPQPPSRNMFMDVIVVDQDDQPHRFHAFDYHPSQLPLPKWGVKKERKAVRRILKNSRYAQAYGQYICRHWPKVEGSMEKNPSSKNPTQKPKWIELYGLTYPIPRPSWLAKHQSYDPGEQFKQHGTRRLAHRTKCKVDPSSVAWF